jgi:hypothetical protein
MRKITIAIEGEGHVESWHISDFSTVTIDGIREVDDGKPTQIDLSIEMGDRARISHQISMTDADSMKVVNGAGETVRTYRQ